jgi:hypothetical protein
MLQLELPHINVLSKIDLITTYGDLPFNLDYYTEVQDLEYLQYELEKDPRTGRGRFVQLNKAICDIVEDFGLVAFHTLCVEVSMQGTVVFIQGADLCFFSQDKISMASLVKSIDQILGCIPRTSHSHSHDSSSSPSTTHQHKPSDSAQPKTPFELLHSLPSSHFPSALDIQEKYVDAPDIHTEAEREKWKAEGEAIMKNATEMEKKRAVARERNTMPVDET